MKKSFTLVELIIVVLIIGTLASIGIMRYQGAAEGARAAKAWATLSEIVASEKRYYLENSAYTSTLTNLDIFTTAPVDPGGDFTYSFSNPWARANRTASGQGRKSYRLNLDLTKESTNGTY